MLTRIKNLLRRPVLENEEDALAASLLYTILVILIVAGIFVPLALNMAALLNNPDNIATFNFGTVLMGVLFSGLSLALLEMTRRGRVRLAGVIMAGTLFLLTTFTIAAFRGTRDTAIGMYILVIAMAGLLLGGRAAFIFTGLTLLATLGIFLAETNGILTITITETPHIVEWIILAVVVFLIGILLRFAFDTLNRALRESREANEELENIQASLAERVAARTQDLELAAEIGRHISQVQEPEEILLEAVELIRSRFDLYYTQIYLADATQNNLVLRAGTGIVGRQLRQMSHRLPISGSSINGTAVINKEPILVADTAASGIFRQNPLLPDTRSEMAVPLIVSGKVIGSLNLQSDKPYGLSEDNLPAFEALAGQLAVALDNARLFSESAEAQQNMEALARRFTRSGWDLYLNAIDRQENIGYTYDLAQTEFVDAPIELEDRPSFAIPIDLGGETLGKIEVHGNEWTIWQKEHEDLTVAVSQRVAQQIENLRLLSETERYRAEAEGATRRLTREGWEKYLESEAQQSDGYLYDQQEVTPLTGGNGHHREVDLVQSLTVRGESIGQLEVEGIQVSDEEAAELVEAVSERLSAHIENLRLTSQTEVALLETERRAKELGVINDLARTVSQQLNLEQVLETVHERIGRIMSADAFIVGLYDHDTNLIDFPFIYDDGTRFEGGVSTLQKDSSIYQVLETGESLVVRRTPENERLSNEVLKKNAIGDKSRPSRTMMFVPLTLSNLTVGVMSVQSYQYNAYSDADLALVEGIASHVSVAIQNARLFKQTEQRAEELGVVNRIAQAISQELELEQMLDTILEEISRVLQLDAFIVALYHEESDLLEYPLIYDDGKRFQELGLRKASSGSMIVKAIHGQEPLLILRTPEDVAKRSQTPAAMIGNVAKVSASLMYVPLAIGRRSTGAVSIQSYQFDAYTPDDLTLLEGLANHIAVALENARLFKETQQRAEELSVVNQVAQVVSQMLGLDELYSAVHEQVQRAIVSDVFYIAIYNKEENKINFPYLYDDGVHYNIDPVLANPELEVVQVIKTRESILVNHSDPQSAVESFPSEVLLASGKAPTSMIFVPLRSGLEPVGAISVQNYQSHSYTQADVDLLVGIAYHLAVALENARLFSVTQQRAEELAAINEIAQAVSGQTQQQELLTTVYTQLQRIMLVDAFTVTSFDPVTELVHYLMVMDEGQQFYEPPVPIGTGTISKVIREGEPVLINRTQEELDELADKQSVLLVGNVQRFSASLLFVPLHIGTEIIGGMSVQSYDLNAYDQTEIDLLVGVANHVAVALENSRLFKETQTTLAETELLYNMGIHINQATSLEDLISVVGVSGVAPGAQNASLTRFEYDDKGEAEWLQIEAGWVGTQELALSIGTRLYLPELPLAATELYTPAESMLIENVAEDERINEAGRLILESTNTKSIAVIPMQPSGKWQGTLVIQWGEPYAFTPREYRLYNSLAYQMSTALSNQLLLSETQGRATQLEKLTQIETALSQSDDEMGVLEAVAWLLDGEQTVSLHYTVEEDEPQTAFTTARWESGETPGQSRPLYEPFNIDTDAGLTLGLKHPDHVSFITDVQADDRLDKKAVEAAKEMGLGAIIVVPLRNAGRWQGFVSVNWPQAHEFSATERAIWEELQEPLAAIIATRRAYLAQQEALSETAVLHDSGAQISVARSYDEVLTVIRKNTILGQHVTNVSIMLFDNTWQKGTIPAYADVLAFWSRTVPEQAKKRFTLADYPSTEKILQKASLDPIVINDVADSPELDENLKDMLVRGFNTNTYVLFPMVVRGEWIGYINAMYPQRTRFSEKEIRRAEALIQQAGVAVQGLRSLEQAEHQAQEAQNRSSELAAINRVVTTVVSSFDLEVVLDTVAGELIELFAVQHVGIALMTPDKRRLKIIADRSANPKEESALGVEISLADNKLTRQVIETRRSVVVKNAQTNPLTEPVHEIMRWRQTEVLVLLPLVSGRETIGTLGLDIAEKDRVFSDTELKLAETIVAQISTAVQNVRLFEQTEARAQELAILNEISQELTATQSVESILNGFQDHVSRFMEAKDAYIALVDDVHNELVFRGFGENDEGPAHFRLPQGSGLTDYVIRTQQPLLLSSDVEEHLAQLDVARIGRAPQSWLGAPLMSGTKAVGMVAVQSFSQNGLYTERHRNLLMAVANQIAIAVESARLFEQAQARSAELSILNEMGRSLTALVDMDAILDNVYRYTSRLMDATNFYIGFLDMKRDEITFALDIRGERVMRHTGTRKVGKGLTEYIINTKEPLLISENVDSKLDELGIERIGPLAASWLGVPMMVGSQVIGVIGLQHWETSRLYNEQHMRLLTSVAGQAAIAIENARLFEQIQARARRERILREVTARVRGATDAESVMRTAVQEVGRALGRRTFVYLDQTSQQETESAKEEAYGD